MSANGNNLGSGTAGGLLAFLDWVIAKKFATPAAISPLKSASRQVFITVEDSEEIDNVDVRSLDREDYFSRFQVAMQVTGRLTPESTRSYRARFNRALDMYEEYLTTGNAPRIATKAPVTPRPKKEQVKSSNGSSPAIEVPTETPEPVGSNMISYPFPLESGEVANLRLPKRLSTRDASRLNAFINALTFEEQKQLTRGSETA